MRKRKQTFALCVLAAGLATFGIVGLFDVVPPFRQILNSDDVTYHSGIALIDAFSPWSWLIVYLLFTASGIYIGVVGIRRLKQKRKTSQHGA
jgi:hypothetical protein